MREKKYYSIGEVAKMFDVNLSLLRFWEKEFPFICPKKNDKGTRQYTQDNIDNIRLIYHLVKEKKLTLEGAKKKIRENKDGVVKNHQIILKLQEIKKEIHEIRKEFKTLISDSDNSSEQNFSSI
jgi:DNA-binding transcriptional MerR regulator